MSETCVAYSALLKVNVEVYLKDCCFFFVHDNPHNDPYDRIQRYVGPREPGGKVYNAFGGEIYHAYGIQTQFPTHAQFVVNKKVVRTTKDWVAQWEGAAGKIEELSLSRRLFSEEKMCETYEVSDKTWEEVCKGK